MEQADVKVNVNGSEAEEKLQDLYRVAKKFKKELEDAWRTGDPKKIKEAEKNFKGATKEVNRLEKQLFDVDKVLRNLGGSSLKDLKRAQRELNKELNSGAVKRNSKDWKALTGKLRKVDTELRKVRMEMRGTQSMTSRMVNGFNKYFMMLGTFAASVVGIIFNMRKSVDAANDYGESLANLSALTGLVGKDLDWLSERAQAFSGSITKDGIRITTLAKDIVDGMTIMGSARPELLKDKEALADVTEQALILAAAAKIEMIPAIDALAASMNQFQLPASESSRIINAIAAGSLAGSAEVNHITESLANSGTVAAESNMSLEETIAIYETLAERQLKGAEAGTQFRSSLISMKAAGLGYVSGLFNMRDAIVELKARIDSKNTAQKKDNVLIEIFGKRNITVGTILANNIDKYDEYTKAVTGTNVATEQAIVNTSHNKAKLEAARAELNEQVIVLGQKLAPALTFSTSSFSYMVKAVMASIKFFNEHKRTIIALSAAIATYAIVVKIATSWEKIHSGFMVAKTALTKVYNVGVGIMSGKIKLVTVAQKLWNLAQKANPVLLIAGILLAAGAALVIYTRRLSNAEKAQRDLNDVEVEASKNIAAQKVELESLLKIARDETKSKKDRIAAVKKLNEISPEYLGNITLEKINTEEATTAVENHIKALEKQARVQAAKKKLVELEEELIDLQLEGIGAKLKWHQVVWNGLKSLGNMGKMIENNANTAARNIIKKTDEILARKEALMGILTNDTTSSPESAKTPVVDPVAEKEKEYKELLDLLIQANNEQQNILRQLYLDKKLDKEQFDKSMLFQEIAFLEAKRVLLEQDGKDTSDIDAQILQKRISLFEAELAAKKKLEEEKTKAEKAGAKKRKKEAEEEQKEILVRIQSNIDIYRAFQTVSNDAIQDFISGNNNALKEGAKTMLLLLLDVLKAQTQMAIAGVTIQSLAQPDSIATFGTAGLIRAGIIIGLIETAFAGVKGLVNLAFADKSTPEVSQYASGRYPVIGADDGRVYNPRIVSNPRTGIIRGPALISERGDEMYIDGPTTRNLVFNYPDIAQGIKNLSLGISPQFASGRYPTTGQSSSTEPQIIQDPLLIETLKEVKNLLTDLSENGVSTILSMYHLKEMQDKFNDLENRTKS